MITNQIHVPSRLNQRSAQTDNQMEAKESRCSSKTAQESILRTRHTFDSDEKEYWRETKE